MKRLISAAATAGWLAHFWSAAAAEVVGVGNFGHVVADLERAMVFYRDVLELEPEVGPTPFTNNAAVMRLGATRSARARIATFRIPGSELGVELIEYRDIERRPVQVRFQDPGAANLQLRVRDLDPILARLSESDARTWTPSGEPVTLRETLRIIFLQDPDGFFVELIEDSAPPAGAPAGNIIGADFELMIADSEETARFYREGLGFDTQPGAGFDDTKLLTDTVNTLGAAFRRTASRIPGTNVTMPFLEFGNITRKPLATRVQDPGTAILQLRVTDVAAMTSRLAAAGGTVISEGATPVDMGDGRPVAMVRDPNNLFLELLPIAAPRVTRQAAPAERIARPAPQPPPSARDERAAEEEATEERAALPAPPSRAPRAEPQTYPVTVVDAYRLPSGIAFTLEDGSVWMQTDSRTLNLPDLPFAAELRSGAMGSFFLVPEERRTAVRVRRRE